tara:strand:- start:3689 stop:4393 length:705 start_codon:yes stop_codon:yes gene_type:complete
MPWMIAAAVVGSSLIGSSASKKAASTQADAANRAADLQMQQFERQVELQEPWRQAGITALNKLTPLATEYTPFGMEQFQQDPGYAFRMQEGMKALERSAAARGGLLSGGMLRGAQRYGQDLASQEYMNAFNRYQAERNARLNPLQSLAGVGQTATNQLGQAGQAMASNVGQAMGAAAQARASGYMGGANALAQGLGTYLNYQQGQNYLNALRPQEAATPAPIYEGGYYSQGYGG